ncbi:hypothetical protein EDB19DRAFT_1831286 [Suillus lakei]|nr:hypothetical protein EDB19DRAFT_1831286 [Suillus lakei]
MVTNVLHAGSSELSPGTQYLGPNWKSLPTYISSPAALGCCSWTNAGPQIAALKRLGKTLNQNRKLISGSWLVLTLVAQWLRVDFDTGNVWRSQELIFSPNDSMEMFATIGGACAAGTASVVLAGALLAGIPMISGPLMAAASAGGTTYGNWGADARLCNARVPIALEI